MRRLISAAILVLLVGAIVLHRDDLASAMGEIGRLDPTWIVGLCALMALGVAVDGLFTSAVTPQLSVGRAILLQQSVTGANNTVVGSGPSVTPTCSRPSVRRPLPMRPPSRHSGSTGCKGARI